VDVNSRGAQGGRFGELATPQYNVWVDGRGASRGTPRGAQPAQVRPSSSAGWNTRRVLRLARADVTPGGRHEVLLLRKKRGQWRWPVSCSRRQPAQVGGALIAVGQRRARREGMVGNLCEAAEAIGKRCRRAQMDPRLDRRDIACTGRLRRPRVIAGIPQWTNLLGFQSCWAVHGGNGDRGRDP